MDQPLHDLRPFQDQRPATHRFVSFGMVALLHVIAIYALASGLAQNLIAKLPQEFKAEVIPPKQEVVKPPPPPPPELQKPPPPFVPPPEINIQTEAAPNTITVQSKVSTPPPPPRVVAPPKPAGITAPVALKAAHECNSRYYPPIAQRLNQHGTTLVRLTISADGQVTDAKVAGSSGYDSLDQAAVRCVTSGSWGAYKPALQDGRPIAAQTEVKIVWQQAPEE
ncbi:MAG TPA: energy transducer TonB [Rhizomicrobium sp.]|jgi:protein TonB|nr:energy transducer TonB [Rhizomicrobium sp.]